MHDETNVPESRAEVVLLCRKLGQCVDFFADAGFRLETVFPADNPRVTRLSGHGIAIQLERSDKDGGGHLRIPSTRSREIIAPNGTRIEFVAAAQQGPTWQQATFVVRQQPADEKWIEGRAGMLYRDLITGRQNGWLIASRIRIPRGGPVPDYVHYHRVASQIIYCRSGWVRVAYEDQGEPIVMRAGDCVLQAPTIRHRVLECSDELEVIEVSSPAEHETLVEHDLELPNATVNPEREFGGQQFAHHQASGAVLQEWSVPGFDARDSGFTAASREAVGLRVIRPATEDATGVFSHRDERRFWFVLNGAMTLLRGAEKHVLGTNSACVLPPNESVTIADCTPDLEFLEVAQNRR